MKIDYLKIKKAVNNARMEQGERIKVGSLEHVVFFSPDVEENPGEYFYPSSPVNGGEIYIWDSVDVKLQRAILFHEIAEITWRYDKKTGKLLGDVEEGHKEARNLENRYARESFDSETLKRYMEFQANAESDFTKRYGKAHHNI